jgi:hypothetical protein
MGQSSRQLIHDNAIILHFQKRDVEAREDLMAAISSVIVRDCGKIKAVSATR